MTSDNFAAKIKQANLADKNDIADFVKKTDFDDMINKYIICNGAKYFSSNRLQNYLVFVPNSLHIDCIKNNEIESLEFYSNVTRLC